MVNNMYSISAYSRITGQSVSNQVQFRKLMNHKRVFDTVYFVHQIEAVESPMNDQVNNYDPKVEKTLLKEPVTSEMIDYVFICRINATS